MIARYDLAEYVASFDYYSWQVMAVAKGAREIVFGTKRVKETKWAADVVRRRFENIIARGPALSGIPYRIADDGEDFGSPHLRELVQFHRDGKVFPRLRSVLPPGNARYTVTLRKDKRLPHRNSNEPAWREFAAEIGAVVIEDYETAPIGLHDRFALYAGAEMNFGVPNGPMHLIVLSDYPMMMFDCQEAAGGFSGSGIAFGENYPWALPNQQTIWEPDDLPVLRRHFAAWKATR